MHDPERLEAYVDGELDPEERERFEDHLAGCADCRRELASRREFRSLAREALDRTAPAALTAELVRGVAESPAGASEAGPEAPGRGADAGPGPGWRRLLRWDVLVPVGAAAGVAAILVVIHELPRASNPGLRPFSRPASVCVLRNGEEPGRTVVIPTGPLILD